MKRRKFLQLLGASATASVLTQTRPPNEAETQTCDTDYAPAIPATGRSLSFLERDMIVDMVANHIVPVTELQKVQKLVQSDGSPAVEYLVQGQWTTLDPLSLNALTSSSIQAFRVHTPDGKTVTADIVYTEALENGFKACAYRMHGDKALRVSSVGMMGELKEWQDDITALVELNPTPHSTDIVPLSVSAAPFLEKAISSAEDHGAPVTGVKLFGHSWGAHSAMVMHAAALQKGLKSEVHCIDPLNPEWAVNAVLAQGANEKDFLKDMHEYRVVPHSFVSEISDDRDRMLRGTPSIIKMPDHHNAADMVENHRYAVIAKAIYENAGVIQPMHCSHSTHTEKLKSRRSEANASLQR